MEKHVGTSSSVIPSQSDLQITRGCSVAWPWLFQPALKWTIKTSSGDHAKSMRRPGMENDPQSLRGCHRATQAVSSEKLQPTLNHLHLLKSSQTFGNDPDGLFALL
ncbi:hypothetical protein WISP_23075 [Willisornis vidua]|uniref:Uncharacterized protein n=1 Tax=Willisornis vidua TaxID=1566151 RepID=A0ABQ9DNB3_9PASS|nr:hypothetical protein WISP_23075 [Willisornis vidua]